MDGASPAPTPQSQPLSFIASLLTAAALAPNASAVVGASSEAIEALNSAAATALGVVHNTVRDAAATGATTPPPLAVTATPAAPVVAAPSTSTLPSSKERKIRGSLLLGEKLLIITQCADKVPREALAARYGVTKRAIYGVWQGRVNSWAAAARGVPLGARCIQVCRFPLVDQLLFEWFMRIRSMGRKKMPISRHALQVKASELARRHYPGKHFAASNGFVDRWVKRHAIRSVHLHGSRGGIDLVEGEKRMAVLREKMVGMDPESILNMDEAALFYQLAPSNSYVLECDAKEARGTELQRAKARITLIITVNATGTFKSIAVIGKAAQPVCFRGNSDLPVRYYSQRKGWMDSTVYAKWLTDLSDEWATFTNKRGFLVTDNASGHDASAKNTRFDIDWLPPNTTARFQPCDQGVINATKTTYRREMMLGMLTTFDKHFDETSDERAARKARETRAKPGALGVADGRSPHVLDAMQFVKAAFDAVTPASIMRCWLRASCTPVDVHDKIRARLEAVAAGVPEPAAPRVDDAREIVTMLGHARSLVPDGSAAGEAPSANHFVSGTHPDALDVIVQWLDEETSPDSIFAAVGEETETW